MLSSLGFFGFLWLSLAFFYLWKVNFYVFCCLYHWNKTVILKLQNNGFFLSSDKIKTNLLDRNIFSNSISIFSPVIKITEWNTFTICLTIPLFCRWSCNFYRICFCSGCVRAPVGSLYSVPIHVTARGSRGQMVLLWFKYMFINFHFWALLVVTSAWKLVNFY